MGSDIATRAEGPDDLFRIADRFKPHGEVVSIHAYGNGNINDTFLVTLDSGGEGRFILQRLNTRVFRHPELVMANMRTCTEHMCERWRSSLSAAGRRWETPCVLATREGRDHWIGPEGSFWRAISFIDASQSFDTVQDLEHAREVGCGLGIFHALISDLPVSKLADTLEGFHITPRYLHHFDAVCAKPSFPSLSPEGRYCRRFVSERREWADVLERAEGQGSLIARPIHGDPKVNNVMIDTAARQAVGMVDLDTVKPGLVHYDIGDCLRSCCNPLGEETERWDEVRFDLDICRAILQGYSARAAGFLTPRDYAYLYDAIRLIAFELGLRFFTDYLEGDVYFKTTRREHNLARAIVQFKLTESIESQEASIRSIIEELR